MRVCFDKGEPSPDIDYARVRAALNGREDASDLSAEERAVFLDYFGDALAQPLTQEKEFWAERRRQRLRSSTIKRTNNPLSPR
jgi:hypothetical protein